MFENYRVFETELAGKKISFETGKWCALSNGSVVVRYGETTVMVNVTASQKPREGIDFFPLSVDFEEKLYAVGRIPGSFLKREGRPTTKAVLSSRVVDRPIRPLFPKDMRNDVAVVMTVLSVDQDCSPEVAGMLGTSFALSISDIPWNGPIAGVHTGLVDGEIIICPNEEQRKKSDLQLTVAGTQEKVVMIEAGANQVKEDVMLEAIRRSHEEIKKMAAFIEGVQKEIGKEKFTFESQELDPAMFEAVKDFAIDKIKYALDTDDKV
ncbi:MAG: polyribonucleotide nucleotidyltransferase, partial [Oscillospiraceae bacterium]|nr:polyribonucleotide nucleotidyltransferase [Oscillospiraceae bacterium]